MKEVGSGTRQRKDTSSKIRAFNQTPYRHPDAKGLLLKHLLCDDLLWVEDVVLVTLMIGWFLPSTSFQSTDFCFKTDSVLASTGFYFRIQRPSGKFELPSIPMQGWVGGGLETGSDPVTAGTIQADRLAAWKWAGPGPGEL